MIICWKNWEVIKVDKVYNWGFHFKYKIWGTRLILQHRFKPNKVKTVYKPTEQFEVWVNMVENHVSTLHDDWSK